MTNGLAIGIFAILVVALVVAPLMSRARRTAPGAAEPATQAERRRSRKDSATAVSRSRLPPPPASVGGTFVGVAQEGAILDANRIEGQVKASSVNKVGKIVGKHPDEALTVLRSWMNKGQ